MAQAPYGPMIAKLLAACNKNRLAWKACSMRDGTFSTHVGGFVVELKRGGVDGSPYLRSGLYQLELMQPNGDLIDLITVADADESLYESLRDLYACARRKAHHVAEVLAAIEKELGSLAAGEGGERRLR